MDVDLALDMAEETLAEYLSAEWTVGLAHSRQWAGQCRYTTKQIVLSVEYVSHHNETDVHDVIIHEVAHAILGPKAGHGPEWRKLARQMGGTGREKAKQMPEGLNVTANLAAALAVVYGASTVSTTAAVLSALFFAGHFVRLTYRRFAPIEKVYKLDRT